VDINTPLGIGEIPLLLPDLYARQQSDQRLLVPIVPPIQVNSEMLAEYGSDLTLVLLYCLSLGGKHIRRLQLATDKGGTVQFLLRPPTPVIISLPVSLAMRLSSHSQGLSVQITQRKGRWQY
jgi:hypothetical protein